MSTHKSHQPQLSMRLNGVRGTNLHLLLPWDGLFGAWGPLLCNHEQTCMNGLLGTVYMYICNPHVDCPQEPIHICLTIMPAHLGMFCVCFCLV